MRSAAPRASRLGQRLGCVSVRLHNPAACEPERDIADMPTSQPQPHGRGVGSPGTAPCAKAVLAPVGLVRRLATQRACAWAESVTHLSRKCGSIRVRQSKARATGGGRTRRLSRRRYTRLLAGFG